jgi:ABC transport system ATP-binding/permease protein
MGELEAKIAKVQEILADPELYSRDPARFQKAMDALTQLQADLHAAEERWLELEMLREELES